MPNTPLRLLRALTQLYKVHRCNRIPTRYSNVLSQSMFYVEQSGQQTPSRRERLVVHSPSFEPLQPPKTLKRPPDILLPLQPPILPYSFNSFPVFPRSRFGNSLGPKQSRASREHLIRIRFFCWHLVHLALKGHSIGDPAKPRSRNWSMRIKSLPVITCNNQPDRWAAIISRV